MKKYGTPSDVAKYAMRARESGRYRDYQRANNRLKQMSSVDYVSNNYEASFDEVWAEQQRMVAHEATRLGYEAFYAANPGFLGEKIRQFNRAVEEGDGWGTAGAAYSLVESVLPAAAPAALGKSARMVGGGAQHVRRSGGLRGGNLDAIETINPKEWCKVSKIAKKAKEQNIRVDWVWKGNRAGIDEDTGEVFIQISSTGKSTVAAEEYLHARHIQRLIDKHGFDKAWDMITDPVYAYSHELHLKKKLMQQADTGLLGKKVSRDTEWLHATRTDYGAKLEAREAIKPSGRGQFPWRR